MTIFYLNAFNDEATDFDMEFYAFEIVKIESSILSEREGSRVLCFQNGKDRKLYAFKMVRIDSSMLSKW